MWSIIGTSSIPCAASRWRCSIWSIVSSSSRAAPINAPSKHCWPVTARSRRAARSSDCWRSLMIGPAKPSSLGLSMPSSMPEDCLISQTLAFGLTDSPAGLAAWIVEKFRAWSDCSGDVESAFTRDRLLANISLYWFSAAIGSSFWPYYARMHGPWPIPEGQTIDVPTGYAEFPREIIRPPRSLAARTYSDIRRRSVMARGGHFAALEQPEALANEVREFFRPLRRR